MAKQQWIYQRMKKWSLSLYRQVDRILVGSPSYIPHFLRIVGQDKVIEKALIQPALVEHRAKETVDYGEGFHVVYAGNLGTIQGLSLLIKQWKTLPKSMHLHLVGSGSQTNALRLLVNKLNLTFSIHFYAHQTPDTITKFFEDADAFYVGLIQEGIVGKTIPHKLIQYLTFGKPILSYLKGDGLTILKTLKQPYILNRQFSNLKTLLKKMSSLNELEKTAIRETQQTYYQQQLSIATASKTLEDHLMALIQSFKA